MVEQLSNIKRDNLKGKEDKMGDMSWLSHLVTTGSRRELEDFLKDKGFRKPRYAAEQFLKAQAEIEEDGMKNKEGGLEITVQAAIDNMDGEPTTADEFNKEWLNEEKAES